MKPWTEEEVQRALALTREGLSLSAAGRALGRSKGAVAGALRRARERGGRPLGYWERHTREVLEAVRRAAEEGEPVVDTVRRLGLSHNTVWKARRRLRLGRGRGGPVYAPEVYMEMYNALGSERGWTRRVAEELGVTPATVTHRVGLLRAEGRL